MARLVSPCAPVALVASVSAIHPRMSSTVCIQVLRGWRLAHHIEQKEVFDAGRNCTCHCTETFREVKCGLCDRENQTVLRLTVLDHFPEYYEAEDTETFWFTLRSVCTSSKNHLNCASVLIAAVVGPVTVRSAPVQLMSRKPRSEKRKQLEQGSAETCSKRKATRSLLPFSSRSSLSPITETKSLCLKCPILVVIFQHTTQFTYQMLQDNMTLGRIWGSYVKVVARLEGWGFDELGRNYSVIPSMSDPLALSLAGYPGADHESNDPTENSPLVTTVTSTTSVADAASATAAEAAAVLARAHANASATTRYLPGVYWYSMFMVAFNSLAGPPVGRQLVREHLVNGSLGNIQGVNMQNAMLTNIITFVDNC
eukprot:TRINITY_DN3764_c0_g2_i1.p1 TRINITY_DN3764_c0_g2~~TRINITY_DN3764_c0_g2_i1.p1  ORF type:complete len:392 (+),score=67.82 TRINITY_DN3764_c0_g2_i1:71-1177(+)